MKSKFSITLMKLNTHIYLVFAFFLTYVTASSFLESGLSEFDYFVIGCCILYFVSYFIVLKKCRYSRVLSVALNLTMVLIINMKIFMLIAFSVSGIDVEIGSVFTIVVCNSQYDVKFCY